LTPDGAAADAPPVYRVRLFREKPTAERARQYVNKGTFYWNSGIFVWKAATILDALRRHQPELHQRLARIREAIGTSHLVEALRREFAAVQPLSIDHAVLEHAGETLVVEAPFRWADLGSWRSLAQLLGADAEGNTIAARHIGLGTADTIVRSTDNHLIATIGLKDLIIVHTPDATLVANRHDEQAVRELVEQLRQRGWVEYL
jgi:mannose-1-phosphate guanylyltransferase